MFTRFLILYVFTVFFPVRIFKGIFWGVLVSDLKLFLEIYGHGLEGRFQDVLYRLLVDFWFRWKVNFRSFFWTFCLCRRFFFITFGDLELSFVVKIFLDLGVLLEYRLLGFYFCLLFMLVAHKALVGFPFLGFGFQTSHELPLVDAFETTAGPDFVTGEDALVYFVYVSHEYR